VKVKACKCAISLADAKSLKACSLEMTFLSNSKSETSTSVAVIYTKPSRPVPSYIMKTFAKGLVNILFLG